MAWYEDIYANSQLLASLISNEIGNPTVLPLMMNAIKCGLLSDDADVASWSCRLLSKLGYELQCKEIGQAGWDWFVDEKNGLIKIALESIKIH